MQALSGTPVQERQDETAPRDAAAPVVNAMSIDVEEYFQVWAFARAARKEDWDSFPSRIEQSVDAALELFGAAGVRATFFTLGWIAERHPAMIRRIVDAGHELGSHGYAHDKVTDLTRETFREDIVRAKSILENISGQPVLGYRAPSFSIGESNLWALDLLQEAGYRYSSSIYPIAHDHYGMPRASRFPFRRESGGILEVPMSTARVYGRNFPCAGGGYFRLIPYRYFRWAVRRLNEAEGRPAIFYYHPWELDPDQPRIQGISTMSRFRHYVNLSRMAGRLERLLSDFRWGRMDQIFLGA